MSELDKTLGAIIATSAAAAPAAAEKKTKEPAAAANKEPKPDAKPDTKPEAAAEPKKIVALIESRMKLVLASAADLGNQFAVVVPAGTPFEHVLEPEFWAHNAHRLHVCDEITVHTDDLTYYGRLYVRDVAGAGASRLNNRAVVALLEHHKLGPVAKELRGKDHEVEYKGPHLKWCVVAKADRRILKDGCSTAEEALGWMRARAA